MATKHEQINRYLWSSTTMVTGAVFIKTGTVIIGFVLIGLGVIGAVVNFLTRKF